MKNFIILLTAFFPFLFSSQIFAGTAPTGGTMNITTSPDLNPLLNKWVNTYNTGSSETKISVSTLPASQVNGQTTSSGSLSFVSGEYLDAMKTQPAWKMVVGRSAIVPVISAGNPFFPELSRQGVTQEKLAKAYSNPESANWSNILKNAKDTPLHIYVVNHAGSVGMIAAFLGLKPAQVKGIIVGSDKELIDAVAKDPSAIGFCSISAVIDPNTLNFPGNISLLPIDKNGNGQIDFNENIYTNWQTFSRGVWIGKYPKALCGEIYATASARPAGGNELAFMKWVLNGGQEKLNEIGFIDLVYSDRQIKTESLGGAEMILAPSKEVSLIKELLLTGAGLLVTIFVVSQLVFYIRRKKTAAIEIARSSSPIITEDSLVIPRGLYFDRTHTWAFMEKDGFVKIGIDDFLQHVTGPLTRIKMKSPGEKISKGEQFLSIIQNGKQLNIKSPITGIIREQNLRAGQDSSLINSSPYNEGWIYMVEPTNWIKESQFLIMYERYTAWVRNEFSQLKDFLAVSLRASHPEYSPVIMQDGGELHDHVLAGLGPEIWDDFQTIFLDTSR